MDRRVLIVESENDFALSMASVLKGAGYQTSLAASAADAQRELEKRRPDLVILRAELPDQSGFVLCGQIKKGKFGQNLPVLLLTSEVAPEGLAQHSRGSNAAEGYLSIPFEMGDLVQMAAGVVPIPRAGERDEVDDSLDSAFDNSLQQGPTGEANGGSASRDAAPSAPPPIPTTAGGPPKLPKRERRSAITDEDRAFLDRTFQSIADRKAELLAESRQLRRSPPRRDLMSTPEGKVQILRDELKAREAQVARISEIWTVRERELLSVEDRVHEKDVELQGLKMQVDDLLRRFNDAQQAMVQKEREHGATVDDLLLQRFANEKDLIEVVAAKEKDINVLRQETSTRSEELLRRGTELEKVRTDAAELEKRLGLTTLEFEVKEQQIKEALQAREGDLSALRTQLEGARAELAQAAAERDSRQAQAEAEQRSLSEELDRAREERESTVLTLETRLTAAEGRLTEATTEIERLRQERSDLEHRLQNQLAALETELAQAQMQGEELRVERDNLTQTMAERLAERDGKVSALEQELAASLERYDRLEGDLNAQIQQKVEQVGELEGEVEAIKGQWADREQELASEITSLTEAKVQLEHQLGEGQAAADHTISQVREELKAARQEAARVGDLLKRTEGAKAELESRYQTEQTAHAATREEAGQQIAAIQEDLARAHENSAEMAEQLSVAKQELGDRVSEVTQLTSQLAQAEDGRASIEERFEALNEQSQQREALLRNDLTSRSTELADVQQKLSGLMQEKQRQIEALTRELSTKTEQVRQFDAKLRIATQESKKEQEKLSQRLAGTTQELESTRKELADRLKQTSRTHQQLLAEHEGMKKELSAQLEAQTQRADELSAQLEREKVEHKRAFEQHVAQVSRAEKQIAHATQETKARAAEVERKLHDANEQVAHRAKKIQELEAAVENLHGIKARLERDSHARVAAAESKASEMAAKLSAALRERKELDARHQKELEDLAGKHKQELERRDAVRMQEVARMQQSVQEKSKALKVVELELARYRTKGPTSAVAGKPIPSAARSPGLPGSAAPARTPAGSKSPLGPLEPGDSGHGSPASSPRASAPRPAGSGLPKPGAPSANKSPPAEPRERNILPPPAPNADDDWTVIVDELDK